MARRGFLAEVQHQARVASREAEKRQRAAAREHQAAIRRAEQARKADERARAQASRAAEADRKRLEKEAAAAHIAAMQSDVAARNAELAEIYDEIDGMLAWTLEFDDFVDLDALRQKAEHPPFDRADLEAPLPPPPPMPGPPKPVYVPPPPPTGLLGKKKKQAEAVLAAEESHRHLVAEWESTMAGLPARQQAAIDEHVRLEEERVRTLEREMTRYRSECDAREAEVTEHNTAIDTLIANLGYGTVDAVQEYVSIVLSNSVYPDHFEVSHQFEFDPSTAEVRMYASVPPPNEVPGIKAYKYTKSTDEIASTALSQKAQKERYSGAVQQVALRSLHEIFEADRRGLIRTISLEVGTNTTDPATGKQADIPFVAVAAVRDVFVEFDLSAVVPAATLDHLGAALSKNPHGLVAADTSGIRTS